MFLLARTIFSVGNVIRSIQIWILSFIYREKPQSIPPITDPLLTLSAVTLAGKIRRREIRSYDVTKAYIERIKAVNSFLNAVIEDRFVSALNEAAICDEQLKAGKFDVETLEKEKPLLGVPFTVKECCSIKGLSLTCCTIIRKGMKATKDSVVVELLRNAGAIPLCVTNTPEICMNIESTNLLFGRTCNPYDIRYTAGGSSGGEGALLGAAASLIGIASDFYGSIRIPAHINGVFGHKPTAGIISNEGHFPLSKDKDFRMHLCLGTMTRYAEDLRLIIKVMTSKCNRDLGLDATINFKRLKIYYLQSSDKTFGVPSTAPEIEQCVLKTVEHFSRYDIRAKKLPIELSEMFEVGAMSYINMKTVLQRLLGDSFKFQKNPAIEILKTVLGQSQHTINLILVSLLLKTPYPFSGSDAKYYLQQKQIIRQNFLDLLGENGIFICPTFRIPTTFPQSMHCEAWNNLVYIAIANVFGFPATHVPMGLNHDGLPIGIQVIAAPYQDRLCLAVAKELEATFGGWTPPLISMNQ